MGGGRSEKEKRKGRGTWLVGKKKWYVGGGRKKERKKNIYIREQREREDKNEK